MMSSSISTSPSELSAEEGELARGVHGTWTGKLALTVGLRGGRSTILSRRHHGPYLVQRPFHPETDGTCHVLLLHPPGGLVSGDSLELELAVEQGACALVTAPAATKVYRARPTPHAARQRSALRVSDGAVLEWFPQETIVFERARAELHTQVELGRDARFFGWEITCLGRPASGEGFSEGAVSQRWELLRERRLLWVERFAAHGGAPLLSEAYGLRGEPVLGTCVVATAEHDASAHAEALRAELEQLACRGLFAVTTRGELVITRYLGPSSEQARRVFERTWQVLRPRVLSKAAVMPRIWQT